MDHVITRPGQPRNWWSLTGAIPTMAASAARERIFRGRSSDGLPSLDACRPTYLSHSPRPLPPSAARSPPQASLPFSAITVRCPPTQRDGLPQPSRPRAHPTAAAPLVPALQPVEPLGRRRSAAAAGQLSTCRTARAGRRDGGWRQAGRQKAWSRQPGSPNLAPAPPPCGAGRPDSFVGVVSAPCCTASTTGKSINYILNLSHYCTV